MSNSKAPLALGKSLVLLMIQTFARAGAAQGGKCLNRTTSLRAVPIRDRPGRDRAKRAAGLTRARVARPARDIYGFLTAAVKRRDIGARRLHYLSDNLTALRTFYG